MYDFAVFIGRFQPFHNGHLHVIRKALTVAEHVIVLVGGATGARRPRNPWSFDERAQMIAGAVDDPRVLITPLRDFTYRDDRWLESVQAAVSGIASPRVTRPKIALIGQQKDDSGYYLKRFPQWASVPVADGPDLHATHIRDEFFRSGALQGVPPSTVSVIGAYAKDAEYKRMWAECRWIRQYQASHDNGEYPRNNVTADAVVIQSGHVLMVRRGAMPGKGTLALPGGHVSRKEHPTDAAIRELREETKIKVPEAVLRGSITDKRWFDDPYRSDLCRTYTKAVLIKLNESSLPKVKGSDDAAAAVWVPLSELKEADCFDDHWHICDAFLGLG